MKRVMIALLGALIISSCTTNFSENKAGFQAIEEELKSKFGEHAFYTELHITNAKQLGMLLNATVTEDPSSLQMGEWNLSRGVWAQTADVTLEITGGQPEDFMFSLNKDISLPKMGELIAQSKKKLKEEKNIDAVLEIASINSPEDGDKSDMQYYMHLKPKNGGTTFRFAYDLNGKLETFDY